MFSKIGPDNTCNSLINYVTKKQELFHWECTEETFFLTDMRNNLLHIQKILRPKLICFHFIGTDTRRTAREVWPNDQGEEETHIGTAARSQIQRRQVCQGSQETGKQWVFWCSCFVLQLYSILLQVIFHRLFSIAFSVVLNNCRINKH